MTWTKVETGGSGSPTTSVSGVVQTRNGNLFDKTKATTTGYYSSVDGTFKTHASDRSSDFIPITYGRTYTKMKITDVVYYDENKQFVSGVFAQKTFVVPNNPNIKYMVVKITSADINTYMIFEGGSIPSTYVPYVEEYKFDEAVYYHEQDRFTATPNTMGYLKVNVANQYTQVTHPSLRYFPSGLYGYKYWLACTPYPFAIDDHENPCILVSNDGINFIEPPGITNPITPNPDNAAGFQSDTELVYNSTLARLECWYRRNTYATGEEKILRKTTTDGITWSTEEELYSVTGTGAAAQASAMAPSVEYDGSKFLIWVVDYAVGLRYFESTDGTNWTFIRTISVGPNLWHATVRKTASDKYEIYYSHGDGIDSRWNNFFISYSNSADNITYAAPKLVMSGRPGRMDAELYRPSFADITDSGYARGGKRLLMYGIIDDYNVWNIGMSLVNTRTPSHARGFIF